jgi:hypothetical protein
MWGSKTGLQYGPAGTCQECKTATPFRIASGGGFKIPKNWSLSHAKSHALYESAAVASKVEKRSEWVQDPLNGGNTRVVVDHVVFACRKCHGSTEVVMWSDIGNNKFLGPFCKDCVTRSAEGHADGGSDSSTFPIYVLRLGKGVSRTLALFRKAIEVRASKIEARKAAIEETQLF